MNTKPLGPIAPAIALIVALSGMACREKASSDQAGLKQRHDPRHAQTHFSTGRSGAAGNKFRPEAMRMDVARSKGRFLELWHRDEAEQISEQSYNQLEELLKLEVPKWSAKTVADVIDEVMTGNQSDERRAAILEELLKIYSKQDPEDALRRHELFANTGEPQMPVSGLAVELLMNLADQDPVAAADWLSGEKGACFGSAEGLAMQKIIRKAVERDPALGMSILNKQDGVAATAIANELVNSSLSRDQKIHLLDEVRNQLVRPGTENVRDLYEPLLRNLGSAFNGFTVAETRRWVESARMSPEELRSFLGGFKAPRNPVEAEERNLWLEEAGIDTR